MELRHLRYFVAVAEELHFGRAAERLRIAQSALSTQIQALERHLGVRLLQRSKRSTVAVTDAGTLVLEEARQTLRQAERTELVGRRAGRGELGRVEIGYVVSAALAGVLSSTVSNFRRNHPAVDIRVQELATPRQLDELAAGRLDVGLLRPRPRYPPGVVAVRVLREALMIALPQGHPLATRGARSVRAAALADEEFVVPHFEEEESGFLRPMATMALLLLKACWWWVRKAGRSRPRTMLSIFLVPRLNAIFVFVAWREFDIANSLRQRCDCLMCLSSKLRIILRRT